MDEEPERTTVRTSAERDAFAAATAYARIREISTPAERSYLEALDDARRDVLHRLGGGVLRGDPAALPASVLVDPASPTIADAPDPLAGVDGERLLSSVEPLPPESRRLALLPFPTSNSVIVAPIAAIHGYDRFRLTGSILRWSPGSGTGGAATVDHPIDLVPLLAREGAFADAEQADRIRDELAESVANLALAQLAKPALAAAVDSTGSGLEAVASDVPAADAAAAFERILTDGHPFHPGGKIRRGMTAADGLAYAPEFTDRIDLRFVGVRRDYTRETRAATAGAADGLTVRLASTFDGLEAALERAVPSDRDPDEYAVIPVHPWQYHHEIPDRYDRQRADGRVVPLPEYAHPATPQLNLRTVVPYETGRTADGPLPRLKLAIGVQTTNVERTLSPHAVANGPQVTDLVAEIEARESLERLGLLAEPAATCYWPPGGPHLEGEAFDEVRHLSGLVRASPGSHALVDDDARVVVASSLVADAPAADRPLLCEVIDRYAAATDATDAADAALEFVAAYADVVVPEQLLLLSKYGIALESHLQNSLVVFEDGRPVATLVRDFGGIRVHDGRLGEHGLSIEPYPESDLDADGEGDLHAKLYYALFQNHLAELVATICHELPVEEACWDRVRERCERAFEAIRSDHGVAEERVRRDERALFADPAIHKALTAMRLRGKRHEYVTSRVSNPLAETVPANR